MFGAPERQCRGEVFGDKLEMELGVCVSRYDSCSTSPGGDPPDFQAFSWYHSLVLVSQPCPDRAGVEPEMSQARSGRQKDGSPAAYDTGVGETTSQRSGLLGRVLCVTCSGSHRTLPCLWAQAVDTGSIFRHLIMLLCRRDAHVCLSAPLPF